MLVMERQGVSLETVGFMDDEAQPRLKKLQVMPFGKAEPFPHSRRLSRWYRQT
jgi:hypothetical protein